MHWFTLTAILPWPILLFTCPVLKNTILTSTTAIGAGYGAATSKIEGNVTKGTAIVLPYLRGGIQIPIGSEERYSLLLEGGVESVSTNEQFSGGTVQTSNATNGKFTLGLKYFFE